LPVQVRIQAVLREVLLHHADEFEVVGARVYSAAKDGRDIGALAGLDSIGVAATTDVEAILALEADCVVFTPQPLDPAQVTTDAIALLQSGKRPNGVGAMLVNPYYHGVIAYTAHALYGADPKDVRFEHEHYGLPADRDHSFPNVTIAKGTAMTLVHVHRGYLGDHHFFTNEEYYYVGADQRTVGPQGPPFGPYRGDSNYVIDVQGEPNNLALQLDLEPARNDNIPVVTYLSVVPLLQSILTTIDAEPGILHARVEPHFRARRRIGAPA
jgi:hypothetical protein